MTELHDTLIAQLYMRKTLMARFGNQNSALPRSLVEIVLVCGRGIYCRADRWRGIRRGPLRNCYQNAANLVISDPDRFIYAEGYAVRPDLGIVVGEHAWVLDRHHAHAVIDPTWRNTKGAAYLGIPFSTKYLYSQLAEHKVYGLLDTPWAKWPVRRLPPEQWLHRDAIIPDFEVPEDLETWYERCVTVPSK